MSDRPVIIIDGLNLFMRHYAAHPAMSKNGDQVGGIVGFLTGIRRLSEKIGPSEIYVIWEGQGSAKKRHLYKEVVQTNTNIILMMMLTFQPHMVMTL